MGLNKFLNLLFARCLLVHPLCESQESLVHDGHPDLGLLLSHGVLQLRYLQLEFANFESDLLVLGMVLLIDPLDVVQMVLLSLGLQVFETLDLLPQF
jgi:hypothetical protein